MSNKHAKNEEWHYRLNVSNANMMKEKWEIRARVGRIDVKVGSFNDETEAKGAFQNLRVMEWIKATEILPKNLAIQKNGKNKGRPKFPSALKLVKIVKNGTQAMSGGKLVPNWDGPSFEVEVRRREVRAYKDEGRADMNAELQAFVPPKVDRKI